MTLLGTIAHCGAPGCDASTPAVDVPLAAGWDVVPRQHRADPRDRWRCPEHATRLREPAPAPAAPSRRSRPKAAPTREPDATADLFGDGT